MSQSEPSLTPHAELAAEVVRQEQSDQHVTADFDYEESGKKLLAEFSEKIQELVGVFGASVRVRDSLAANLRTLSSSDETVVASRVKKFCEYPMAILMGTHVEPINLFGSFASWIGCRMKRISAHSVSVCQSIFRAKALLGHASDWALHQSLRDHWYKLAHANPDDSTVREIYESLEPVLANIRRSVMEDLEVPWAQEQARATGGFGSTQAVGGKAGYLIRAFHGCRAKGGTAVVSLKWMFHAMELDHLEVPLDDPVATLKEDNERWSHVIEEDFTICEEPVVTRKMTPNPFGYFEPVMHREYPGVELRWNQFLLTEALAEVLSGESRKVKVTSVSESAFKIRTVTTGSSAASTYCAVWQQSVFKAMRRLACFPSFGRQIDGSDISGLFADMGPDEIAGSSDFRSATDLLNPRVTNLIVDFISSGFVGQQIVMDDNADKDLYYPMIPRIAQKNQYGLYGKPVVIIRGVAYAIETKPSKPCIIISVGSTTYRVKGECMRGTKVCGQLMGQKTSFPLLCLVNLGCSLAALRRHGLYDPKAKSDSPLHWRNAIKRVIINGDDRLARSTRTIEKSFWEIAEPIGLCRSPGKSHESRFYASINSQDYVRSGNTWKRVPCIRVGLLFGVRKLAGDPFVPSSVITPLFESVPFRCQKSCVKLFQSKFGEKMRQECTSHGYVRNLFLPVALGGMGQVAPELWDWYITDQQRILATKIKHFRACDDFNAGPHLSYAPKISARQPVWFEATEGYVKNEEDLRDMEEAVFRKRTRNAVAKFKIPERHHFHFLCTCGDYWTPSHTEGIKRGGRYSSIANACRVPPCEFKERKIRVHYKPCACNRGPWDNAPDGFYSSIQDDDEGCNHPPTLQIKIMGECPCCPDERMHHVTSNHKWLSDKELKSMVRPTLTTDWSRRLPNPPKVRFEGKLPTKPGQEPVFGSKFSDVSYLSAVESVKWAAQGKIQLPP